MTKLSAASWFTVIRWYPTTGRSSETLVPELEGDGQTVLRLSYKNTMIWGAVMCSCVDVHLVDRFFCDRSRMSTDTTTDSGTYPLELPLES